MNQLKAIKGVNLATYYLLPTIGLSEHSFGESNFINTYLHKEDSTYFLVVQIFSAKKLPVEVFAGTIILSDDTKSYAMFKVPEMWNTDIDLFMEGKYSKLSQELKELIVRNSGLSNLVEQNGVLYTDIRILALDKHEALEEALVNAYYDQKDYYIGKEILKSSEFLPIPGEEHIFRPLDFLNKNTL